MKRQPYDKSTKHLEGQRQQNYIFDASDTIETGQKHQLFCQIQLSLQSI